MIALLIGGTVVLCIGLLTVVFGIPIKEFSFGNTMILAGAVVACTGIVLVGLYFVGRELRNLTRRLEAGLPVQSTSSFAASPREAPAAVRGRGASTANPPAPPKAARSARAGNDEMLFPSDAPREFDDFDDGAARAMPSLPASSAPPISEPWQDEPVARSRAPAPPADNFNAASAERPRRDIMFSSKRRDGSEPEQASSNGAYPDRDSKIESDDTFENAWPQSDRARQEPAMLRNGRSTSAAPRDAGEPARERFQTPRRADASAVSIVKSGVVDSMAYSLYSDGSIEAQMPEGMVRFSSIDELRTHLDQR